MEHGVHSGRCVGLLQGITTVKRARGRKGINNRLKINVAPRSHSVVSLSQKNRIKTPRNTWIVTQGPTARANKSFTVSLYNAPSFQEHALRFLSPHKSEEIRKSHAIEIDRMNYRKLHRVSRFHRQIAKIWFTKVRCYSCTRLRRELF